MAARTVTITLASLATAVVVVKWMVTRKKNPRGLPLPPGPKGLPIIGNALDIPQTEPWLVYRDLSKIYGDVIYLEALGNRLLVLNSLSAAQELLDKRAKIYSDRPSIPVFDFRRMTVTDWAFSIMRYGASWQAHRKLFHQFLGPTSIPQYEPVFEQEIGSFLRDLSLRPDEFLEHARHLFGSIILRVAYGSDDPDYNNRLIDQGEMIVKGISDMATPGRYLVNMLPFMKWILSWLPGAGWKRRLNAFSAVGLEVVEGPFRDVKERLESGLLPPYPSMARELLESFGDSSTRGEVETIARNICCQAYLAGADTTIASAQTLMLALAMHPDVQRKAQRELDTVVGQGRLPKLADKDHLPYICAIVKETARWHPVVPLGIVHANTESDEFDGYLIPEGTCIMTNVWAILHDPSVFEDPLDFKPERYLTEGKPDASVLDPQVAAFGFGRRMCPGRHLSDNTLFLMVASLLSMFDLAPPKDVNTGEIIPLKLEVSSQMTASPVPYKLTITPRFTKHDGLFTHGGLR